MTSWTQSLPYFADSELSCKCGCNTVKLDIRFAAMLPALRQLWGKPITFTSVCRCPKHNKAVDGHATSFHLTENPKWPTTGTAAADVAWRSWPTQEKLSFARLAHAQGFRVGLHNGFVHIDIGRLLGANPKPFLYGTWDKLFSEEDIL